MTTLDPNSAAMRSFEQMLTAPSMANEYMLIAFVIIASILLTITVSKISSPCTLQYAYGLVERLRYFRESFKIQQFDSETQSWKNVRVYMNRTWKFDESTQLWKLVRIAHHDK